MGTVFERFIENKKIQKRQENFKECIEDAKIKDKKLLKKIEDKIVNNPNIELNPGEIIRYIANYNDLNRDQQKLVSYIINDMCKDPSKQNIYEIEGLNWLKNYPELEDVAKPYNPELVLKDGVILARNGKKDPNTSKSIDVIFKIGKTCFVGTMKYTKNSGGAQDNQFNDVCNFLHHGIGLKDVKVIALVDGEYYTSDKIEQLKSINKDAIVMRISDIENLIDIYMKE